jgi:hypothetical protein
VRRDVRAVATLVMFVHPKCPCSHASAAELSRLMGRLGDKLGVRVVAVEPTGAPKEWDDAELLAKFRRLPGVEVTIDREAKEAFRFGARTSGQVNLYDARGQLRFRGGITSSRGHEGDNPGSDAIIPIVQGADNTTVVKTTKVYGCSLLGPQPITDTTQAAGGD